MLSGANMKSLQGYFIYTVVIYTVIEQTETHNTLLTPINNYPVQKYATTSCILELTRKFIRCGALLTLVDTTNRINPLIIKSLSSSNCYSFLILRSIHRHWRFLQTEVYIIYSANSKQFKSNLNALAKEIGWNPRARFLLTIDELEKEEIIEIFQVLLMHNVFDVLLIIEQSGITKVYSYFPFDNQKCGQVSDDIIKEEDCSYVETIEKNSISLENKFKNCTIVVAASEDVVHFVFRTNTEFSYLGRKAEGIEQRLLENIAKLENLTIKYILVGKDKRYGVVLPNHTVTGVLSYLQNSAVSIVGGGFFLIKNRVEWFDFIWGYNYANLYLFTPAFGEENWKKVFQEFSVIAWILIVLSFFFTTAVVAAIRKYLLGKEDDKLLLVIKMWGYIYGHPDIGLFRAKKMRVIILIWILFTYFISSFYNTAYYSLLTRKHEEKLREKPDNLQSLPFKPCLTDATRTYFQFNFNETLPGIRTNSCRYSKTSLDLVANSGKYYSIVMDYSYKLREYRYIDEDGNPKLQTSKYSSDMIITMYTKRGFPLLQKFQRYAAYHFESGIFQNHLKEIYYSNKIFHYNHKAKYRNSRLSDHRLEFYILFVGYFISCVCFIIEIYK